MPWYEDELGHPIFIPPIGGGGGGSGALPAGRARPPIGQPDWATVPSTGTMRGRGTQQMQMELPTVRGSYNASNVARSGLSSNGGSNSSMRPSPTGWEFLDDIAANPSLWRDYLTAAQNMNLPFTGGPGGGRMVSTGGGVAGALLGALAALWPSPVQAPGVNTGGIGTGSRSWYPPPPASIGGERLSTPPSVYRGTPTPNQTPTPIPDNGGSNISDAIATTWPQWTPVAGSPPTDWYATVQAGNDSLQRTTPTPTPQAFPTQPPQPTMAAMPGVATMVPMTMAPQPTMAPMPTFPIPQATATPVAQRRADAMG